MADRFDYDASPSASYADTAEVMHARAGMDHEPDASPNRIDVSEYVRELKERDSAGDADRVYIRPDTGFDHTKDTFRFEHCEVTWF